MDGSSRRAKEDCQSRTGRSQQPLTVRIPGRQQRNISHRPKVRQPPNKQTINQANCPPVDRCKLYGILSRPYHSVCCVCRSRVTTLIARRGFIRLALEHGCDLVPTMVFREKYMYNVYPPPRAVVQFFLRFLKTPVLLFAGRYFTWLPFHTYLSITFDAPIPVQRVANPSAEQVDALWSEYRQRLEAMWTKYKTTYGYDEDERLEICAADEQADGSSDSSNGSSSSSSGSSSAHGGHKGKKRD